MNLSMNWLSDFVSTEGIETRAYCDRMTDTGSKVEGYEVLGEDIENVLVARITKITPHENSDHLWVCQVNIGTETVQIVTGAQNVFEGALVPAALDDSYLPCGAHIVKGKLRGVESNGMLCSGGELCLTEEDYEGASVNGILILKETHPVGTDMREVLGLEAESVTMAWRLPGATSDEALMLEVIDAIMNNGEAGIIDLNLLQEQELLSAYSFPYTLTDYTAYFLDGKPKEGQTLDEVKEMLLAQVDSLRQGNWDESLLTASIANYKLDLQKMLEDNDSRADLFVQAFVNNQPWADVVQRVEKMEKITKSDVVAFANTYLKDNNYAVVYKRQGDDPNIKKVDKPAITPIFMNRDTTSAFLREIQTSVVAPIEPVFVDFEKDMSQSTVGQLPLLYKKNETNDLFTLQYVYDLGKSEVKEMGIADSYLDYLGTSDMTAADIKLAFYNLACSYEMTVDQDRVIVTLSGLAENMPKAMTLRSAKWPSPKAP